MSTEPTGQFGPSNNDEVAHRNWISNAQGSYLYPVAIYAGARVSGLCLSTGSKSRKATFGYWGGPETDRYAPTIGSVTNLEGQIALHQDGIDISSDHWAKRGSLWATNAWRPVGEFSLSSINTLSYTHQKQRRMPSPLDSLAVCVSPIGHA